MSQSDKTDKIIQKIILARVSTMPNNIGVSIGSNGEFSKDEILEHIKKDDQIGKKFIEVQMSYLQSLKNLTDKLIV